MSEPLTERELRAAHCWEPQDHVPGRPAMTEFRRRLRLQQARWREAHGHPIGTQPIAPRKAGPKARLVGSRLPLDYARDTGANFLGPGALESVRARTSVTEPNQSVDHQRLWADLLWSPAMAVNLFGELAVDHGLADEAVHAWWPDAPGTVDAVRFIHSPGWLDPRYLNSLRAFDAVFELDLGGDRRGIVGVDVKYHERRKAETPRPENLRRYREVAERSGAFSPSAIEALVRTSDLAVTWLEHLLLHAILQQPSGIWTWGRYVLVHPEGNTDMAEACARYEALLEDRSTFAAVTLEELLGARALSPATVAALRERYLPVGAGPR